MQYDHILDDMEISTDPFSVCELHGHCSLGLGRLSGATLHYILAGNGECALSGANNIPLSKGTLVLVPAHMSHSLHSFGYAKTPVPECHPTEINLEHHIIRAETATEEESLLAICGHISIGLHGTDGLIDLIRHPMNIHITSDGPLDMAVTTLLDELSNPRLGSRAIIRSLLLQVMLHLFRERLLANDPNMAWMRTIGDMKLWVPLKAMLDDTSANHTVESLAIRAGMSRSTFAKRFSEAHQIGPMEFLRKLRMNKAAELLQNTDNPVKVIAQKAGFKSRSAFTRAFEKKF